MNLKYNIFVLVVILSFFTIEPTLTAQTTALDKQKAKLIYNFSFFLQWENDDAIEVIKIGVLNGSNSFMRILEHETRNGYDNIILIEVINFKSISSISETHILYLPKSETKNFLKVKRKIKGYNTALVTDGYNIKKNLVIDFVKKGSKIKFYMNAANLKENKVIFNEKDQGDVNSFKSYGGILISTKALLEDSEESLAAEKKNVEKLKKQIKEKLKELADKEKVIWIKEREIKSKEREIKKQTEYLLNQIDQISAKNREIEQQKIELSNLLEDAKNARLALERKTRELNEKEKEVIEQEKKIDKHTAILKDLEKNIKKGQEKIDVQNAELVKQGITIQFQKNMLLFFIIITIIILVMAFFIWNGYRNKKKANKQLAKQKLEIEQQAAQLETINKELEKLSIVASETSTAVMILDVDGKFEWINFGFTKMYGYSLRLLSKKLGDNIIEASSHPDIKNIFESCIATRKPVIYESKVIARKGKEKWAQTTLSPIVDHNKKVTKLVLIDSDITKIKEVEREIIEKNKKITAQTLELELQNTELEKLSLVASKTENSVVIFDENGEIEWVNDGFERLLELNLEEFKAEYGSNLFESSLNTNIKEHIEIAIKEKKSINYTAKTKKRTGNQLWIQTTLTPIFDDNDNLIKYIAIDADVTDIKLAEEKIAHQNENIKDSILYARKIQTAVLPPDEYLAKLLPEYFIMFRPKDIVSGDFYWATHKENKVLIAAADCTGHGVPGGFMSMLGFTFLNEITGKMSVDEINPGKILTDLRESVKTSLRQTGKEGEAKDGMDIALLSIDFSTQILEFAGANNPLVIVREFDNGERELVDIKADDMPIGIFHNENPYFKNHKIKLQKGDMCYIFSDGFPDQFGGKSRRKFMLKRFKRLLLAVSDKPIKQQEQRMNEVFDKWKGKNKQIDDIIVIGIRI